MTPNPSSEQLLAFLAGLAEEHGGSIPFERFMREALYHPEFGYYTANVVTVGRRGDFSTSATLSNALGAGLANWIARRAEDVAVIELGAGDGSLAEAVLAAAGWWKRRRWRYQIVEISPKLREAQQARLRRFRQVKWRGSIEDALEVCGGRALVFSNELVDAFPVILAAWDGAAWQEVRVGFDRERGLREVFAPLDSSGLKSTALEQSWPAGQRIEIHDSYRRWLWSWAPKLKGGTILTIDYGGSADANYARRPEGTLRGYFRHQAKFRNEIYQRFGRQDLTADVNFDDLRMWGDEAGLRAVGESSQAEWLAEWTGSCWRADAMADPSGAGGAFRVLEQRPS